MPTSPASDLSPDRWRCLYRVTRGSYRHEISLETFNSVEGRDFWVVRVRLFGDRDMPAYYIVSGLPK